MEEKILEIIKDNYYDYPNDLEGFNHSAKEIADHFEKFIEWIRHDCTALFISSDPYDPKDKWIVDYSDGKEYTLKELHQYYCNNVLNLKDKR